MRRLTTSPRAFRRVAVASLVANVLIVVTGGLVRLTGSGLGCSTWPQCEPGQLAPSWDFHPAVEFGNRLVTNAVVLVVLATVVAAALREPRRRDLVRLSLGLVLGVAGQVVLGGIVVLYHLTPALVAAHFLVSMLLVLDATVLVDRAGRPDLRVGGRWAAAPRPPMKGMPAVRLLSWLVVLAAAVVVALGTVVTGAGPHSGDARSARLGWDLETLVHVHSDVALVMVGGVVALGVVLRFTPDAPAVSRHYRWLLALLLAQVAVGFGQWFLEVPAGLVAVHITLATLFWVQAIRLLLAVGPRAPAARPPASAPEPDAESAAATTGPSAGTGGGPAEDSHAAESVLTP